MTATLFAAAGLAADPVVLPKPVSAVWVVLALIGVLALGYGLKRLADHVLLTKGDSCHLEGE